MEKFFSRPTFLLSLLGCLSLVILVCFFPHPFSLGEISKNRSITQRLDSKKFPQIGKNASQPRHLTSSVYHDPAPLDHLSEQEEALFPGASVVEAKEIDGPEPGEKTRLRILKTECKYPMLRTEEVIDTAHNNVVSRAEMAADHFLVTLPKNEDPNLFFKKMGTQAVQMTRVTEATALYRVDLASSSLDALPQGLQQSDAATRGMGEANFMVHEREVPNNRLYYCQWPLLESENYYEYFWYNSIPYPLKTPLAIAHGVNASAAWDIRTDASSVIVAVIDSGIRYTHQSLAPNMWHNPSPSAAGDLYGWNAVSNNGDPMDDEGHGTHCAGTIGAVGDNSLGTCGVAWKVQLMACKAMNKNGTGYHSDQVVCLDYALSHGAQIMNCSFGGYFWSYAQYGAFKRAHDQGVIVVCAAGEDSLTTETPDYPSDYQLDNMINVTALSSDGTMPDWCNVGPTIIALAAPGEDILSTWNDSDSSYDYMAGTSCAAPFVTGAFALLKAQFPNESYQQLIARLVNSVDQLPSLKGKTITGGTLNIAKALTGPTPGPESFYHPHESWSTYVKSLISMR
ncbi:MAG: S8 family peptidase [Verrucomicrobiae bacterium]|nr:S8 family peptidase [Verrucomicrobiae bacterium]